MGRLYAGSRRMRTGAVGVLTAALVACAHSRSSAEVGIAIELDSRGCLPTAGPDIPLRISNASDARVSFHTSGAAGPPYRLHPSSAQLLSVPSDKPWQVVLEHFVPATHEVTLSPGDQANFAYQPSAWPSDQETGIFKLEVRDTHGHLHHSSDMVMCHPDSSSKSSFKTTPLTRSP